jgi:hypothetical protein
MIVVLVSWYWCGIGVVAAAAAAGESGRAIATVVDSRSLVVLKRANFGGTIKANWRFVRN